MFTRDALLSEKGITHCFFGRRNGVSKGIYASLNCGLGTRDDAAAVRENRRRVALALDGKPETLLTLWQHHSAICVTVMAPWSTAVPDQLPRADAMVTDRPGLLLGILTADCAPVLFRGRKKDGSAVIGAAHAGWRGALGGVLEATVSAMKNLGAGDIAAAVGPCLCPPSYEVSADFLSPFLTQDKGNAVFFAPGKGDATRQFNLPGYVGRRLRESGVVDISTVAALDTYTQADEYFSYRRTTHQGEDDYGRQVSVIAIR